MQDYNTFKELRGLEATVGIRYLTHESDDEAWQRWGKRTNAFPEDNISYL